MLDASGRLSEAASPWARLFLADVVALFECTGDDLKLELMDCRVPPLWEDTEVRAHFLQTDVAVLRAASWTRLAPPPRASGPESSVGESAPGAI